MSIISAAHAFDYIVLRVMFGLTSCKELATPLQGTRELVSCWMFTKKPPNMRFSYLKECYSMLQGLSNRAEHSLAGCMLQLPSCLHFYTRLNKEFWLDLCWWVIFFDSWAGLSLLQCTTTQTTATHHFSIQTDASGSWGCRAFFPGKWLQLYSVRVHLSPCNCYK